MRTRLAVVAVGLLVIACGEPMGGGSSGTSCFVADTRVATPHGEVPIQNLRVGDEVLAFRSEDGAIVVRTVVATLVGRTRSVRVLDVDGTRIETTDEHPFWDAERRAWTPAARLDARSVLVALDGTGRTRPVSLAATTTRDDDVAVYNLTVEGPEHTFFANGIAVHNKSPIQRCDPDPCPGPPPGPEVPIVANTGASDVKIAFRRFGPDVTIDTRLPSPPLSDALLAPSYREEHTIAPGASVPLPSGSVRTMNTVNGDTGVGDAVIVEMPDNRAFAIFGRGRLDLSGAELSPAQPQAVRIVPMRRELAACTGRAPVPLSFDALPGAFKVSYEVKTLAWRDGCLQADLAVTNDGAPQAPVVYHACLPADAWPFPEGQRFYVHPTSTPARQQLVQPTPPVVILELWRVDAGVLGGQLPGGAFLTADVATEATCGEVNACGSVTAPLPWRLAFGSKGETVSIAPGGAPVVYPSGAATTSLWLANAEYTPVIGASCPTAPTKPVTYGVAAVERIP